MEQTINLSKEEQLIAGLCRLEPFEKNIHKINSLLPLDWSLVWKGSIFHGTVPLIYHRLKSSNFKNHIPEEILENFKRGYYQNLFKNMVLFKELKELLEDLTTRGIKVMVLKGGFLAENIYHNIALRPMADLDLLVLEEELDTTEKSLMSLGYSLERMEYSRWWAKRFGGERTYVKKSNLLIPLDVHWNISKFIWGGIKKEQDLWNNAQSTKIAGINTLSMSIEDMIFHISTHLSVHHGMFRLIWLRDICELIQHYQANIDWEKIVEMAKQSRLDTAIYYSFKYAQKWLAAMVPEEVLNELKPVDANNFQSKICSSRISMNQDIMILYRLLKISGIIKKGHFLLGNMFPSVKYLRKRYSIPTSKMVYFYWLYRPLFVLYRGTLAFLSICFTFTKQYTKRLSKIRRNSLAL
ncbi:MAG: hypothetical protein DRG35_05615 [Deltaproteobacteria bacterium]|nr:MAG: hypothetical protein DRG35_05615 [Deltaproteobacteria bacterium]